METVNWSFVAALLAALGTVATTMTTVFVALQYRAFKNRAVADHHHRLNTMMNQFSPLHDKMVRGDGKLLSASPIGNQRFSINCYREVSGYYSMLELIASTYSIRELTMIQIDDFFGDRLDALGYCELHKRLRANTSFYQKHKRVYDLIQAIKSHRSHN